MRPSRRQPDEMRAVTLDRGVAKHAEGSCFVKFGDTHVLVTATLDERLPPWLGTGRGWVTAEYGMLPRATNERTRREASAGKQGGRTLEIQRLIGRSLRAVVDLQALGERQITVDCDVIQADGGTRTAAITGAWVALSDCIDWMTARDMLRGANPLRDHVAAVSCGMPTASPVLDLDYAEDFEADTDANFVMTGAGGIVEIQGTAEKARSARRSCALIGARAQGHRQARRTAEARRAVRCTAPITGRLVIATHNPGKLAEMRELLGAAWRRGGVGGRLELPSRRRPARPSRPMPDQGGSRREGVRPAGLRRRFRPRGRCARRRAGHLFGALGGETRTSATRWSRSRPACASATPSRRDAAQAHFVSVLCVAWPDGHVEEFEGKVDGTLVWPPRGTKASATIRCSCPTDRLTFGEMTATRSTACRPRARPLPPRPRLPQVRGGVSWAKLTAPAPSATQPGFGVYVHWPFCSRSAPIATSTAMSATAASTRSATCAPSRARSRRRRNAPAPHRVEHLLRRRHAVADGARDGRRDPRRDRPALAVAPDAEITLEANPTSVEASAFAAIAPPASIASRSACRRSTMRAESARPPAHREEALDAVKIARTAFSAIRSTSSMRGRGRRRTLARRA